MSDAHQFRADEPAPASELRPTSGFEPVDLRSDPIVSVVTPFFNIGDLFEETAQSVFRQTFRQWEWVIVNDASTDPASLEVLDRFRAIDPRVVVIDQDSNLGPGAARNRGFEVSRGSYVMQLDNDDMLEPTAIEKMFWFLETHPEFSFVKGYTVGFGEESYIWANGFHFGEAFLEQNYADVMAMIRRDVAISVGGYDATNRDGLEDWEFWLACAAAGHWGGTIHEPLGWYRRRGSHTATWSNWDGGPKEEEFRSKLQRKFPQLWQGVFPSPRSSDDKATELQRISGDVNLLTNPGHSILMIVPWLEVGGADRVNLQIIDALTERGWDVTIVTTLPSLNRWESEFKLRTPDVFVLDRFLELEDRPGFLDYLIRSRAPDVLLVSNSWFGYDLLPFVRARHPDLPIVDLTHAEESWNDGGFPRLSNANADALDVRITGSEHVRDWMVERGGTGEIRVWYTGVDISRFTPVSDQESTGSGRSDGDQEFVILFVGRLADEKQPQVVVRVVDRLVDHGLDATAVLVGDGPMYGDLAAEVSARSLDPRIAFERDATDGRVAELMTTANLFLLPSLREGIAVTVYEAMASGLPVMATDVGGQSELVTQETGILVANPDSHDIVVRIEKEIARLIENPELLARYSDRGRERVENHFDSSDAADRFQALLLEAIEVRHERHRTDEVASLGDAELSSVIERHRSIEAQQVFTLDQWAVSSSQMDDQGLPDASAGATYGNLMRVFGAPYRFVKQKNPAAAVAIRDRVRRILGYRR